MVERTAVNRLIKVRFFVHPPGKTMVKSVEASPYRPVTVKVRLDRFPQIAHLVEHTPDKREVAGS